MEEGDVLPFDGLMPLPLNGNWHADANRVRIENIGDVEEHRQDGKDQKAERCEQPEPALDKALDALRRHPIDNHRQTPDDCKVDCLPWMLAPSQSMRRETSRSGAEGQPAGSCLAAADTGCRAAGSRFRRDGRSHLKSTSTDPVVVARVRGSQLFEPHRIVLRLRPQSEI